jgi:glucose/arabinose dehydrogenase
MTVPPAVASRLFGLAAVVGLLGCGESALMPLHQGAGPDPRLPPPARTLLPTVNIAPARGWDDGTGPQAAAGLAVSAFADGLVHPRWLYVLPNGDVLVAETNRPPPGEGAPKSLKRTLMGWFMKRAGAGTPSPDRITLLRDADGDGVAETRSVFASGLRSPFGMALVGDHLYVANADAIVRLPYLPGAMRAEGAPEFVAPLPGGPLNHHWTKSLVASADGKRLYAGVGSNSNIGENGMAMEAGRAAIWQIDLESPERRVYASGLRNPVGMDWEPRTGTLWTVVNERDELGSDLVPDYLTAVRDGAFYGWPYSYFGRHVDERVEPARPDLVGRAVAPDYALGAHTASLGLAFHRLPSRLSARFGEGAFIGQHGSWNRRPHSGYKVVFVPFRDGRPSGELPQDVLAGFLSAEGEALGRPVGVAQDRNGDLLVADDVGNTVWRVTAAGAPAR